MSRQSAEAQAELPAELPAALVRTRQPQADDPCYQQNQ